MFSKFFGKKKNDGFYLQLDEDGNVPTKAVKAEKAKPAEKDQVISAGLAFSFSLAADCGAFPSSSSWR